MSLAPRAVIVHRTTEYEELLARHGTHGQAEFFLTSRGRSIREVAERHRRTRRALTAVSAGGAPRGGPGPGGRGGRAPVDIA
ncbi:hypothetical protein ACFWXX_17320, partial [Streptomyces sp. NPDC059018]